MASLSYPFRVDVEFFMDAIALGRGNLCRVLHFNNYMGETFVVKNFWEPDELS